MALRYQPSLPSAVEAALLQRAVVMGCCEDTGVLTEQEDGALLAACEGTGCSPCDAPPQTEPKGGLDSQGLHSYMEGGSQGKPIYRERTYNTH